MDTETVLWSSMQWDLVLTGVLEHVHGSLTVGAYNSHTAQRIDTLDASLSPTA